MARPEEGIPSPGSGAFWFGPRASCTPLRILVALLIPVLASLLQWALWDQVRPLIWFFYYPALFLSAWISGPWGAIPAAALSGFLAVFFFVPLVLHLQKESQSFLPSVVLFLVMGALFGWFHDRLAKTERQNLALLEADRRRNQAALESKEALLARVSRMAKVGGWAFETATGKGEWTEEVARIHDLDPSAPICVAEGLSYYTGASRPIIERAVREAIELARPFDLELEILSAKGVPKWVRTQAEPVVEHGQVVRVYGSLQDITERKQAEVAFQEGEDRLKLFFAHSPASLAMFDREMRYLAVSQRWLKDYGLTDQDLLGKSHYEVFPEITEAWKAIHRRGMAGEVVRADEDHFVRQNGTVQWLRWEVRPWRNSTGLVGGIVIFSEDITEIVERRLEVLRLNAGLERRVEERTAELTAANQELEAFAYAVSHDLRAPLRAMTGFSHALQEDFSAELPDKAKEFLDQITLGGRRMGDLIDGLLVLSRSTRGDLQRQPVDLSRLAEEARADLERSEPGRRVHWHIQPRLWTVGDPRMLKVVLSNLLGNAWKYTSHQTEATITFEALDENGIRFFHVRDDGAGFDTAYAAKLFKPFQRLHRQDEFPGLGVGLATVQRIIHRHGGRIDAEGEVGQGATFRFTLHANSVKEPDL